MLPSPIPVGRGSSTLPLDRLRKLRREGSDESPQSRACRQSGEIRIDLAGMPENDLRVMFMAFVHS